MTLLLGLGIIGSRSADQLIAAGHPLKTWNRTAKDRPETTPDLTEAASQADVILCYLRDDQAVREVFSQIKDHLNEGKTFINHATIDPETPHSLARAKPQLAGASFIMSPEIATYLKSIVHYSMSPPVRLFIWVNHPLQPSSKSQLILLPRPLSKLSPKL